MARVLGRLGVAAAEVAEMVEVLAEHVRMDRLSIGQVLIVKLQRPAEKRPLRRAGRPVDPA